MKGFVVIANYQGISRKHAVSVETLKKVSDYVLDLHGPGSITANTLREIAQDVEEQFARDAEASELEALGGTDAAERGWNALRRHNPNVDKSNGSLGGEIVSFSDLSHRQKVNYAVFAAGVLDVKREPRVFTAAEDVPAEVLVVVSGGHYDLLKRGTASGWWWVESADDWVPADGWPWNPKLHRRCLPLTEVVS